MKHRNACCLLSEVNTIIQSTNKPHWWLNISTLKMSQDWSSHETDNTNTMVIIKKPACTYIVSSEVAQLRSSIFPGKQY